MHLRSAPIFIATFLLLLAGCSDGPKGETVPYETLVRRLADPAQICSLDAPGAKIVTS
jgi:hypothetical protein